MNTPADPVLSADQLPTPAYVCALTITPALPKGRRAWFDTCSDCPWTIAADGASIRWNGTPAPRAEAMQSLATFLDSVPNHRVVGEVVIVSARTEQDGPDSLRVLRLVVDSAGDPRGTVHRLGDGAPQVARELATEGNEA